MMDKLHTLWWTYVWGPTLHFSWAVGCAFRGYHLSVPTKRPGRWVCLRCFRYGPCPDRNERQRFERATRSFSFPTPPRYG